MLKKNLISSLRELNLQKEEGWSKSKRHVATWQSRSRHEEARPRENEISNCNFELSPVFTSDASTSASILLLSFFDYSKSLRLQNVYLIF